MRSHWKKITIAALFILAIAAFFYFGIHEYITLETIRAHRAEAVAAFEKNPVLVYSCFVAAFSAINLFCFMGTWVIMIGAGAVFGTGLGALSVGLAYAIGGTLHLWLGRYFFRDFALRRWGHRLAGINEEIEKDGPLVLFGLRLISVIPYPTINFTMSLTTMRTAPFFFVTLIACTIVGGIYANTGSQLAEINSIRDVASVSLFASLALLGAAPLLFKIFLDKRRKKRNQSA